MDDLEPGRFLKREMDDLELTVASSDVMSDAVQLWHSTLPNNVEIQLVNQLQHYHRTEVTVATMCSGTDIVMKVLQVMPNVVMPLHR